MPKAVRSRELGFPMTDEVINIVADNREAGSGVIHALKYHPECIVRIARMRLGDYQVGGRLLFERKTLRELAKSINDGRFLSQARRLAANPLRPVIIRSAPRANSLSPR